MITHIKKPAYLEQTFDAADSIPIANLQAIEFFGDKSIKFVLANQPNETWTFESTQQRAEVLSLLNQIVELSKLKNILATEEANKHYTKIYECETIGFSAASVIIGTIAMNPSKGFEVNKILQEKDKIGYAENLKICITYKDGKTKFEVWDSEEPDINIEENI